MNATSANTAPISRATITAGGRARGRQRAGSRVRLPPTGRYGWLATSQASQDTESIKRSAVAYLPPQFLTRWSARFKLFHKPTERPDMLAQGQSSFSIRPEESLLSGVDKI